MASMKHVGVNIAMDPLMSFTQTETNGGFLLVSGDDPGLSSSQNEQDNRILAKFANLPILDPSDSHEAKTFVKKGLDLSEEFLTPVMLRITSRLCHSRSPVSLDKRVAKEQTGMEKNPSKYSMIPANSRGQQYFLKEKIEKLTEYAYDTELNVLEEQGSDVLVITSGLMYQNLKELGLDIDIWKLGLVYPINKTKALEVTKKYSKVLVLEEMMPFIENELQLMGIACEGKKYFNFTGELDVEAIEKGLNEAGVITTDISEQSAMVDTITRHPVFCTGCPHRPTFDIIKKSKADLVIGDIGCYSLAALPPFDTSNTIISMGASVGVSKGLIKARLMEGNNKPIVSVIGDGTFFHSGIPGFINLLHQKDEGNLTLLILNNSTTAMTGGQHNGSSGLYNENNDLKVEIKSFLETIGFERVNEVNQYNYDKAKEIIEGELHHEGLSVVILNGVCALKYKLNKPHYYVDPEVCIGCRTCIRTGCPPLEMKAYEGIDDLKSSINPEMCVGCSVCAQVCPVNAIKNSAAKEEK
jgi:indolepyruvate ferredoxin oxidoreductase alpha subunit